MIMKQPYHIRKGETVIFTVRPFKNDKNQWRYDICYGASDYAVYTAKSESAVEAYYYGYMDGEADVLKITRPNNAE